MTDKLREDIQEAAHEAMRALIRLTALVRDDDSEEARTFMKDLRAALAEPESGLYLTIVYRDVQPGPECTELCRHPKVSAVSWSHAIDDRNAARAATPRREWQSLTQEELEAALGLTEYDDLETATYMIAKANAIEAALKEKNT